VTTPVKAPAEAGERASFGQLEARATVPRVALIHYWLVNMRGGERVLEALAEMFPEANIYTHAVAPAKLSAKLRRHRIVPTFVGRLPRAARWYQRYLPLMPLALEALDLSAYDLVICSEAGPAKGVILRPGAVQIAYCHSPMRYIWDKYHFYRARSGRLTRAVMPLIAHYLRLWDASSAMRVDTYIANSAFVAQRIRQAYRREAIVVHPPVDVAAFRPSEAVESGDFYLWCGELVAYKQPDLAVDAFTRLGKPLVVIGDGEEMERLKHRAGENIRFLGRASFDVMRDHMARCRALIFPGEEDFGMVPVEVQASGRPVIALARGGALETVVSGKTGILYEQDSVEGLLTAVGDFERSGLAERCTADCMSNAARFDKEEFKAGISRILLDHGIALPAHAAAQTA
jgi:glycosyltransferase involved in cell wall biosynthesis